jgi:serine carboxypeptidase-like clade 2
MRIGRFSHCHSSSRQLLNCDFSIIGPLLLAEAGRALSSAAGVNVTRPSTGNDDCDNAVNSANAELGNLNIYQMFADIPARDYTCAANGGVPNQAHQLLSSLAGVPSPRPNIAGRRLKATHADGDDNSGFPAEDACIDNSVEAYLNRPDVRAALHVRADAPYWTDCTRAIDYSYADLLSSMVPTHQALIASGKLRTLIFSGDVDGIVPASGSRMWVDSLELPVVAPWRAWYATDGDHFGTQLAGYTVDYAGGFSFATIRGAGHMCPTTQPFRSRELLRRFLSKEPLSEARV